MRGVEGDQPFCLQFPGLFKVTTTKNLPISTILGNNTSLSWDFTFRRNLSDVEFVDLERLLSLFSSVHLSPSVLDAKAWISTSSRAFSVNSSFLFFFFQFYPISQIIFLSTLLIFCRCQKSLLKSGPLLG